MSSTLFLTPSNATDAAFRAWGSAISAAIAAEGFVQTADSGQINWSTVTSPAFGAVGGYEVWRFADSLQATAPIFFKIEYGSESNNGAGTKVPKLWITVGTGSDGAGTITGTNIAGVTGAVTTRRQIMERTGQVGATNAADNVYVNGDGAALLITGWLAYDQYPFFLLIERSRNWDGTANGDGLIVITGSNGTATSSAMSIDQICYLPSVTTAALFHTTSSFIEAGGISPTTCVVGSVLYPRPVPTTSGPRAGAPSQFVMAICPADYPVRQQFAMSHYGTSRTWVSAGANVGTTDWGNWGNGNIRSFVARVS